MRAVVTRADLKVGSAGELGVPVDAVAAFYRDNWQRRIALGLPDFYRWQFVDAPESRGSDHCCVALDQNEIVGVMGLNPRSFVLAGVPRASAEMTTWVVAEAARGRGVGRAILARLMARYDVLFGPGITEAALPLYLDAGFRHVRSLPRFTRVFRSDLSEPFVRATARGREILGRSFQPWRRVRAEPIGVEAVADLARDHLRGLNHYVRDVPSLSWRYGDHPVFKYAFHRVGGAVVGLRHDEIDGVGIVHVVECFGEARALADALSFVDQHCREREVALADFTCTASTINRHALAAGWFSVLDDRDVQVTNLFHPPELRDPATTSLVLWSRDGMTDLLDLGQLYLTKGDLDLDRPTLAYYERHGLAGGRA